jgi:hypothetical protein
VIPFAWTVPRFGSPASGDRDASGGWATSVVPESRMASANVQVSPVEEHGEPAHGSFSMSLCSWMTSDALVGTAASMTSPVEPSIETGSGMAARDDAC